MTTAEPPNSPPATAEEREQAARRRAIAAAYGPPSLCECGGTAPGYPMHEPGCPAAHGGR